MAKIARALVSVSDKTGLVEFVRSLREFGIEILSTGRSAKVLSDAGIPVIAVSDYTGSPEMLDGRVKTLHPKIHGGLLGRRDLESHRHQMRVHHIQPIDLVVVNLYPFEATVAKPGCSLEEAIEDIDIGGPSMLRSAAKNHRDVTVIVDPADYAIVLDEMRANSGFVSATTNFRLAKKAFQTTARYDGAISDYLGALNSPSPFGETFHLQLHKAQDLRYGENPHQQAALYGDFLHITEQLHGKELSFNNIVDINAAMQLMLEFGAATQPVVAILKHNTPCGVATAASDAEAYRHAYVTDPDSPFGGIIISNRPWSLALARIVDEIFSEVLIAPDFEPAALDLLRKKKNRRLMRWHPDRINRRERDIKRVFGGALLQDPDIAMEDPATGQVVTRRAPTADELRAMTFGLPIVKHIKSNAVVFGTADRTLAVGGGQTSRVDPVRLAVARAARLGIDLTNAVVSSEAFFPFPDGVEEAAKAGATALIQPGGSTRDEEVIAMANQHNMAMVFTGVRHFKH
ncbi:MAG TPA: bifunctional phosphoribosylaminoimidazolecarboxamide formyltransferase/IMP cyclohydrolase [Candidatus Kryptonia bacterium]|nr:bifunctional phosphoribosylaminoimidazolecarboxamide formyltransferase/IMP cyclohydrolase [Candidatus Kryptonia bacterium]